MSVSIRKLSPGALLLSLALGVLPANVFGLDDVHSRYTVTSWTDKDGMLSSYVRAIAQDRVGYLWLATYSGLLRFDGVRFLPWEGPNGSTLTNKDLSSLIVARDGSIWIGGVVGGVTRIRDGSVTNYPSAPGGLFDGYVSDLVEDSTGTIWAAAGGGVARFNGTSWERAGTLYGLPERQALRLHCDRRGVLWVSTVVGVFRRAPSSEKFERVSSFPYAVEDFADDNDGNIIATHPTGLASQLNGPISFNRGNLSGALTRSHSTRLLQDRIGNLWIGTRGQGVFRVHAGTGNRIIERLTHEDGLSVDSVLSMFEDREGNIWIGTPFGLNRVSENDILSVSTNQGVSSQAGAVTAARDGSIWAATSEGLLHFSGGDQTQYVFGKDLPATVISALHSDPKTGILWISTDQGLIRFANGHVEPFVLPGGLELTRVRSITTDSAGRLWVCDDRGVFRSRDRHLNAFDLITGDSPASSVYADRNGRVWIGFVNGTVGMYDERNALVLYSETSGLPGGGTITAIYQDRQGTVWIGTHKGLSRFDKGRFATIDTNNGFPRAGPIAISDDDTGHLWLGVTDLGILRIDRSEFDRAVTNPGHPFRYSLYDTADGLRATPVRWRGTPTSARANNGAIWFLTGSGLAVVDPGRLRSPRSVAPLLIEDIIAGNHEYSPQAQLSLPPNSSKLQIDYTVSSLAPLPRINFRYRLDGFDEQWIEAGTRRQAFYTNVPPGHYQFRLEANDDGLSNRSEILWQFSIAPTFYQTRWFAIAWVGFAGLSLWGLWQFRLRQVKRRFALVLDERTRMAREIHDTLLQGLVGVAMQFKVIADYLHSSPEIASERLERLRKMVEHYICETRQSIWDLRSSALEAADLVSALREAGETVTTDKPVRFEMAIEGKPYTCAPKVEEQFLRVAREALSNALRHAHPTLVRLEIVYGPETVRLRITDDGDGFVLDDPDLHSGAHWGLTSMRERAQQVNGELHLESIPGKGTAIDMVVPLTAVDSSRLQRT